MKKLLGCVLAVALLGCASFSTNIFRTEQTAVNLAYTGYVGWTNYLAQFPTRVTPQASNDVKQARLRFAASVATLEAMRIAYETNSALQPQVQAALATVVDSSSNIVWLIQYWKQQ